MLETKLGANQLLEENERLNWYMDIDSDTKYKEQSDTENNPEVPNNPFIIKLNPMEIKTFIITISRFMSKN